MPQRNQNINGLVDSSKLTPSHPGQIFDRRRFLGGAALASLTAAATGSTGLARVAEPISGNFGEPYLNVRNFGARGNGKTDDTAAIQKALDAAGRQGGNVVLLPRGEYLVRGYLHVPDDVTLQGVFRAPNRGNAGQNKGSRKALDPRRVMRGTALRREPC